MPSSSWDRRFLRSCCYCSEQSSQYASAGFGFGVVSARKSLRAKPHGVWLSVFSLGLWEHDRADRTMQDLWLLAISGVSRQRRHTSTYMWLLRKQITSCLLLTPHANMVAIVLLYEGNNCADRPPWPGYTSWKGKERSYWKRHFAHWLNWVVTNRFGFEFEFEFWILNVMWGVASPSSRHQQGSREDTLKTRKHPPLLPMDNEGRLLVPLFWTLYESTFITLSLLVLSRVGAPLP